MIPGAVRGILIESHMGSTVVRGVMMRTDSSHRTRRHVLRAAAFCLALIGGAAFGASGQANSGNADGKGIGVEPVLAVDHVGSQRYALVVGIDSYEDERVTRLDTPERDAQAFYRLLTDPQIGGVERDHANLLLGRHATYRNLRIAINALRQAPEDATIFIFMSGHGGKEGDEAYWLTYDTELDDLGGTAMPDAEFRRLVSRIPSRRVVVIIDSCYAAAMVNRDAKATTQFDELLRRFTGTGRAYLMAAGDGEEAIEADDLKHSVFSYYVLKGLRGEADANSDGVVVLQELIAFTDTRVSDEARRRGGLQRPVVRLERVAQPSRFALTVNPGTLAARLEEAEATRAAREKQLAALKQFYLDDDLSLAQYQLGVRLLTETPGKLTPYQAAQLREYVAVAEGRLSPAKLDRALAAVAVQFGGDEAPAAAVDPALAALWREIEAHHERGETQQALDKLARLLAIDPEHEAALALRRDIQADQRQSRIELLLTRAREHDSPAHAAVALEALRQLLVIDPGHREASELLVKVQAYARAPRTLTNDLGMRLAYIAEGRFKQGSARQATGHRADERQHVVILTRPFYMGETEVTRGQFARFIRETGYVTEQERVQQAWRERGGAWSPALRLSWHSPGFSQRDDHPVVGVSWNDAVAFCRWLSKKEGRRYGLPTEAQWEYACRAGSEGAYSWGDDAAGGERCLNAADRAALRVFPSWSGLPFDDGHVYTAPVGSFRPNAWGLYDMQGNVGEWCSDWYGEYPSREETDPQGPNRGSMRVIRGSGWCHGAVRSRSANRSAAAPGTRFNYLGFRVVLEVDEAIVDRKNAGRERLEPRIP